MELHPENPDVPSEISRQTTPGSNTADISFSTAMPEVTPLVADSSSALTHQPHEILETAEGDTAGEHLGLREYTEVSEIPPARPEAHDSLRFPKEPTNIWTTSHWNKQLEHLGAESPAVTRNEIDQIKGCYEQAPCMREYHDTGHGEFVGQDYLPPSLVEQLSDRMPVGEATGIKAVAGPGHDAVYMHVDEINDAGDRPLTAAARELLGDTITYTRATNAKGRPIYTIKLSEQGTQDANTRLVADVFGITEDGILHNMGGNEFLSALISIKIPERHGASAKALVGIAAATAATIPFRPALVTDEAGNLTNGHMGELAHRVHDALIATGATDSEHAWQDTNDIMLVSTYMGGVDVSAFTTPNNFAQVVDGGRRVKKEEIPALRKNVEHIGHLQTSASIEESAPLLYSWLGSDGETPVPVPPENVPDVYMLRDATGAIIGPETMWPPLETYHEMVENTRQNARMAANFSLGHKLGIELAASIATELGEPPEAPVPGIVHSRIWAPEAVLADTSHLDAEDQAVYEELLWGTNQRQVDMATPQRSPIGGIIYGALGAEGAQELLTITKQISADAAARDVEYPFAEPAAARRYVNAVRERIGDDNFRLITTELHRVARHYQDDPVRGNPARMAGLTALGGGIIEY